MFLKPRYVDSIFAPAIVSPEKYVPPKNGERYFALLKINEVNNRPTENKEETARRTV